jgi:hypothetical protein
MLADASNDRVEIRMEQRLTAAQRDDAGPERRQLIDAAENVVDRNRQRPVIVLVTVRARQVAPPNRNEVRGDRLIRESQRSNQHARFTKSLCCSARAPPQSGE